MARQPRGERRTAGRRTGIDAGAEPHGREWSRTDVGDRRPSLAGKLTPDQCNALIGHLSVMKSERLVREAFGLTREVVDKAAAGQAVPREVAERIIALLDR